MNNELNVYLLRDTNYEKYILAENVEQAKIIYASKRRIPYYSVQLLENLGKLKDVETRYKIKCQEESKHIHNGCADWTDILFRAENKFKKIMEDVKV